MTIIPYGDSALLVNFEQKIDPEINAQVVALSNAIISFLGEMICSCTPAFCSITIGFNPGKIQFAELSDQIKTLYSHHSESVKETTSRLINIPVCYNDEYAIDKADIINQTGLSWENIIQLHTSEEYRVYMLGFIAGFAYMGTLPQALACSRKDTPRMYIPSGTVGIAGLQTGIYPTRAHAGWQLMGRTPITIFDAKAADPFLFRAGDRVKFEVIEPEAFAAIATEIEAGTFDINSVVAYE